MRTSGTLARAAIELGAAPHDVAKSALRRDAATNARDARATRNERLSPPHLTQFESPVTADSHIRGLRNRLATTKQSPRQFPSTVKSNKINEAQFLTLLQRVLPKTTQDAHLVNAIYEEVAKEVRLLKSLGAFEKFCEKGSVPDLEPETVAGMQAQLAGNFGEENVVLTPAEDGLSLAVEISLPDHIVNTKIKVAPPGTEDEEPDAPFVPFPVSLPEDPELVWVLARRENLGPDEASRAMANIEEEFWGSKKGQNLQRKGVEKTFAEFISNVPAPALKESGIKRYHKDPETLKTLRMFPKTADELVAEAGLGAEG